MLNGFLTPELVSLNAGGVHTPEEAIRLAGSLMERAGKILPTYTEKMVEALRTLGPYIVLAPGIAMPHANPDGGDVLENCVALVTLKEPVPFGSAENDPVRLILALAGTEHGSHLEVLQTIGEVAGDPEKLKRLESASSYEDLEALLK